MEELIKQAFLHVDMIGPHVQAGHYDLLGPNGEIILPQVWDKVIEPDWAVTMHMWPMDRHGPGPGGMAGRGIPGRGPPMGGVPIPGRPHGVGIPGRRPGMGGQMHGPPPPPIGIRPVHPGQHRGGANVVNVDPPKKKSSKNTGGGGGGIFSLFAGPSKPPKK